MWSTSGTLLQTFDGFKQTKFILKPSFAGPDEDLVLIGDEDGKVLVWSKLQGTKLGELPAHHGTTNSITAHPKLSNFIVTSGDDNTIKIWNLLQI